MMYSASTASVGSSGSTLVGVATREQGPPPVSTVTSVPAPSAGPLFDPIYDATGVCFCHRFLNPFGVGASQCLVNPCLLHYCRVCNIQLNSCRQAKIHSEGKKHEKRLSYLKFCLESTDSSQNGVAGNLTAASGIPPNTMMASTNTSASTPQAYYVSQQQQQPPPQQQQQQVPPVASCQPPVNYQQQPTVAASTAYYYQQSPAPPPPPTATVAQPPPPPASMATYPMMPTSTASYYADYTSPPPSMAAAQPPPPPHPQQGTVVHMVPAASGHPIVTGGVAGVPPGSYHLEMHQAVTSAPPSMQAASSAPPIPVHSVMSPSLTSGFSGSGDCKSTETSSILSAASYSSGAINGNNNNNHTYHHYEPVGGHGGGHGGYYSSKRGSGGSGGYNAGGGPNNNNNSSSSSSNNNSNYYQPSSNGHEVVVGGYHAVNNYVNNPAGPLHSNGHVLGVGVGVGVGHRGHHGYHHHHHPSRSSSSYTSTSNTAGGSSNSSSSAASSKSSHNNSNNIHNHHNHNNNNKSVFCETCQIPFPSVAVLDNHLKGSRHARRVKSQQAFRQLKESGTLFRFRGSSAPVSDLGMSSGAIRCEVCQVSVNSSHQLQAHIIGHKHKVRAIRRGVKTNQAVLSPSSSLLTSVSSNYSSNSSGNVAVPPSSKLAISSSSGSGGSIAALANNGNNGVKNNNNNSNNNGATTTTTSRHRRSSVKNSSKTPSQQQQQQQNQSSSTKAQKNQQENSSGRNLALSRHRSSGCLQSRHCHSTLSLSRARSSSALNRVQSRSMNLLMIQANGMTNGTTVASNSSNASSNSSVVLVDDEEDEGVATDATTEGQLNSKDIKSTSTTSTTGKKPLIQSSRPRRSQGGKAKTKDVKDSTHGIAQEMAWLKLSKPKNKKDSVNGNTPHHDKSTKILKNGFNVNAQEWKPSRRTSVGNTSVKDIPMLDMFLQRLGDRHSYSDPCSVPNGESAVNGPVTGVVSSPGGPDPSVPTTLKAGGGPPGNSEKESTRA